MKKLATLALTAVAVLSLATVAFGQAPEPGDFVVSADAAGTETVLAAAGFVPFNMYLVGHQLDGQVKGFEAGLSGLESFTILSATLNPSNALNLGNNTNYLVGTGGCFEGTPFYTLVTLNVGFFAGPVIASDSAVCLTSASPSSPALGGRPGWLQCDGALRPAGVAANGDPSYPDGCLIMNPTQTPPVATETTSFGEIKARF